MFPNNFVKIMMDYCADPVWCESGGNGDLSDLPVSDSTRRALFEWAWFYDNFCDDYKEGPSKFPYKEFTKWGRRLAGEVKEQLPDWTVHYFNEETGTTELMEMKSGYNEND